MTATLEAREDDWGKPEALNDETTPVAAMPALRLPADLIGRVFSQLDCVDLLSCSLVCKKWCIDASEIREGWKNEYIEAWKLYGLGIKRDIHPPSSACLIRGAHSWCP
ncbi:F-box/SPRY domain-containing protein 1-like [Dioscorea cayenensis subsp. rotundata]|uniref:F-box/SPRY domain-containing protein 1-like n=1 Tax=Dioscorea cayennensis subsp. rotundata TaxID=55577 RepID=A0AB40AUR2_DIOCR|nr:F-box/SPRY domain-containing protein 1-like [Dioscorea cayenensis subsp. rotundata]